MYEDVFQNWNMYQPVTVILKRPNDFWHKEESHPYHQKVKINIKQWLFELLFYHSLQKIGVFTFLSHLQSSQNIVFRFLVGQRDTPTLVPQNCSAYTYCMSINTNQIQVKVEASTPSPKANSVYYSQSSSASTDPVASSIDSHLPSQITFQQVLNWSG